MSIDDAVNRFLFQFFLFQAFKLTKSPLAKAYQRLQHETREGRAAENGANKNFKKYPSNHLFQIEVLSSKKIAYMMSSMNFASDHLERLCARKFIPRSAKMIVTSPVPI